jgi:hypothetical protein
MSALLILCENKATCNDQENGYDCTCAAGYTGVHCEIDIDECTSNPCENKATCNDQENGYDCTCAAGYTGIEECSSFLSMSE